MTAESSFADAVALLGKEKVFPGVSRKSTGGDCVYVCLHSSADPLRPVNAGPGIVPDQGVIASLMAPACGLQRKRRIEPTAAIFAERLCGR
jgi:hypothetical protein